MRSVERGGGIGVAGFAGPPVNRLNPESIAALDGTRLLYEPAAARGRVAEFLDRSVGQALDPRSNR
jgi:hypothetical protein